MKSNQPQVTPIRDADLFFGLWPWSKGPRWRLDEPYAFYVDGIDYLYVIPANYEFDGQSVPPWLHGFPFHYGPAGVGFRGALIHDYLCDLYAGGSPWLIDALGGHLPPVPPVEKIHETYYKIQLEDNQRPSKAKMTYFAVRNFGPGSKFNKGVKATAKAFATLGAAIGLGGCQTLPLVTADRIEYESAYPVGGTSIVLTKVEVTESKVTAESYKRTTKLFGFTQTVRVEGYSRDRHTGETEVTIVSTKP